MRRKQLAEIFVLTLATILLGVCLATSSPRTVVEFEDENLEAVVREKINKPKGPIYLSEVEGIQMLDANSQDIKSLKGIGQLADLKWLYCGGNEIVDIGPLAELTDLEVLGISENDIAEISPLGQLQTLEWLYFNENKVRDISPLADLTGLIELYFGENQVSDIHPLANLPRLIRVGLWGNRVRDITPLANNEELAHGDQIDITRNYLDLQDQTTINAIKTLKQRGAYVYYSPQRQILE